VLGILVSLLVGAAAGLAFYLPGSHHAISGLVVWGLGGFIVSFALLGRRATKRVEPLIAEAQKHLQAGRLEKSVETLKAGFAFAKWHPLLPAQLHAQIGILLYVAGKADDALPHLLQASRFVWVAPAMLGCYWFKKKEYQKMRPPFEKAVRSGKKESLSFTVYAYCLRESGDKDGAVGVVERGIEALKKAKKTDDHRLEANLERLKAGKALKTENYREQWAQFRLDKSPPPMGRGPRGPGLDPNHPALRGMRGRRMRM
jgi:tetratricopeptide (TPR) repeat protein